VRQSPAWDEIKEWKLIRYDRLPSACRHSPRYHSVRPGPRQQADSFGQYLLAILKALVWPAFLVYEVFQGLLG
jgi:hypothetical protein